jgi:hypothetical protein
MNHGSDKGRQFRGINQQIAAANNEDDSWHKPTNRGSDQGRRFRGINLTQLVLSSRK